MGLLPEKTAATEPEVSWFPLWTPLAGPATGYDYFASASAGLVISSISDTLPIDQIHWYRDQVRDEAGNWSPPWASVKAAHHRAHGRLACPHVKH
jgi:hypothetical protein